MSTYNALANQLKKGTTFIWKILGQLYGGVYQGINLTTHLVGKFYLVKFNSFPNRYIMELIMSDPIQQYQQLHPR